MKKLLTGAFLVLLFSFNLFSAEYGPLVANDFYEAGPFSCADPSEYCKIPTLVQIQAMTVNFLSYEEKRNSFLDSAFEELEKIKGKYNQLADDFESEVGKNSFSESYRELVNKIDNKYQSKVLRSWVGQFGVQSTYINSLGKLTKFVMETEEHSNERKIQYARLIENKIFKGDIYKLNSAIYSLNNPDCLISSNPPEFTLVVCDLRPSFYVDFVSFDFNRYLQANNCENVDHNYYATRRIFSKYPLDKKSSLHPIRDVQFYKNILHGPNGETLRIECTRVKRIINHHKSSYSKEKHTLEVRYKRFLSIWFPGSYGDLSFHFIKEWKTYTSKHYISVLREALLN